MAARKGVMNTLEEEGTEAAVTPEAPTTPAPAPIPDPPEVLDGDLDPNEEIFPGGPKWKQVNAWKEEHGDVYVTSFSPESHHIWRTLTRFEYKRLVKNMEMSLSTGQVTQAEANFNNEELMCEICVLFPPMTKAQMSGDQAGIASIISQEIMEASGFVAMDVRQL